MSVREYIGARYIPLFADPIEWSDQLTYEPLTVVTHEGGSYVSKQQVPVGIAITNTDYWILWADYNAQIEAYRREVQAFDGRIDAIEAGLPITEFDDEHTVDMRFDEDEALLPKSAFSSTNTVKKYVDDKFTEDEALLPKSAFSSTNTVKKYVDDTKSALEQSLTGNTCPVTDIADYVTVPHDADTNIQITCMAYDANANVMYIANRYQNDTKTLLRKITNFTSYAPGSTAVIGQSIVLDIEHPNAMSISNGYLYIFGYDDSHIYIVDLATFTLHTTSDLGYSIRTGAVCDDVWYIQPYTANMVFKFCMLNSEPFTTTKAMGIKTPLNTNYAWIQDAEIYRNAFVRMCSMTNSTNSNPYLEVNTGGLANYPIIVPINHAQNYEWESVTYSNDYCYMSYSNVICRSAQIAQIIPQVNSAVTGKNQYWQSSDVAYCFNAASQTDGLPAVWDGDNQQWTMTIPYRLANAIWGAAHAEMPSLLIYLNNPGVEGNTRQGGSGLLPLTELSTALRNFCIWGNTSNGLWCMMMTVNRTNLSGYNDIVITIKLNTYTEIVCTQGNNVTCQTRATTNLTGGPNCKFRLVR